MQPLLERNAVGDRWRSIDDAEARVLMPPLAGDPAGFDQADLQPASLAERTNMM